MPLYAYVFVRYGLVSPEKETLKELNCLRSTRLSGQIWHSGVTAVTFSFISSLSTKDHSQSLFIISLNLILKIYFKIFLNHQTSNSLNNYFFKPSNIKLFKYFSTLNKYYFF
jgi:hypothetical protein